MLLNHTSPLPIFVASIFKWNPITAPVSQGMVLLTGDYFSLIPLSSYSISSCFSLGTQGPRGLQGGGSEGEIHLLPAEALCEFP